MILSYILLFFIIVKNSHLNVIWTHRPNIKVLNITQLVHKYRRFTNLYFAVFVWWIYHLGSALDNWFVFSQNIIPFWPVLSQISWVCTLWFLFCYNFPHYHVIIDDLTLKFEILNTIKDKIVWILDLLVLMRSSCNHDARIFWVKNFLKLVVSDLSFVFGLYTNVLLCDDVLWNLKRK